MMRPDPLLLLLDEPTAAIDAETEHDLFSRWILGGRDGDLIVVLQDGQVREIGSHAELIAARGLYAELFQLRSDGYR